MGTSAAPRSVTPATTTAPPETRPRGFPNPDILRENPNPGSFRGVTSLLYKTVSLGSALIERSIPRCLNAVNLARTKQEEGGGSLQGEHAAVDESSQSCGA